jgi:hypothetical protein
MSDDGMEALRRVTDDLQKFTVTLESTAGEKFTINVEGHLEEFEMNADTEVHQDVFGDYRGWPPIPRSRRFTFAVTHRFSAA